MKRQSQLDDLLYGNSQDHDDELQQSSFSRRLQLDIERLDGQYVGNDDHELHHEEDMLSDDEVRGKYPSMFPEVNGPSYDMNNSGNDSISSAKNDDLLESRNMEYASINKFIQNKRKEEQMVNHVIEKQVGEWLEEKDKLCAVIDSQSKQIKMLEHTICELEAEKKELEQVNTQHFETLHKKDLLFKELKETCKHYKQSNDQKQSTIYLLENQMKSMETVIDDQREALRAYTDQERNLTDFKNLTPKRAMIENQNKDNKLSLKQLEKVRREKASIQNEFKMLKEELSQKQNKIKSIEDEYKRKISVKEKKIKQLEEGMGWAKDEINKTKKNSDTSINSFKERFSKAERDIREKEEKIQEVQRRLKMSIDESKKKEEKINHLLIQIAEKNKKINELIDKFNEESAKNEIDTKIQAEKQRHIDRLQAEIKSLKEQNAMLEKKMFNFEKQASIEGKVKKQLSQKKEQIENLRKEIDILEEQNLDKDKKVFQLKRKNEELSKKTGLKHKNSEIQSVNAQLSEAKQKIVKLNKEVISYKRELEQTQQKLNKFIIFHDVGQRQEDNDSFQYENQFQAQQIEALETTLEEKQKQINKLKLSHEMEVKRLEEENMTFSNIIQAKQEQIEFKEKSLDFLHMKFVSLQRQKAQIEANRNFLHSSFYDQSYEEQVSEPYRMYTNKIQNLENKLKEKQMIIERISSNQESRDLKFEISQLKARVKELNQMVLDKQKIKIAPQSLSPKQTVQFLLKTMKRVHKSGEMMRTLSKYSEFRDIILLIQRTFQKEQGRR